LFVAFNIEAKVPLPSEVFWIPPVTLYLPLFKPINVLVAETPLALTSMFAVAELFWKVVVAEPAVTCLTDIDTLPSKSVEGTIAILLSYYILYIFFLKTYKTNKIYIEKDIFLYFL